MRDVFLKSDAGSYTESFQVTVPKHGTKIYVAKAEIRLERTRYEAETGYSNAYTEIDWGKCQYSEASFCSGGYKVGYIGGSANNDLQWRNVYSKTGGKYSLTIAYICGESRNITVSVNGETVQTVSANSGGWQTVGKKRLTIQLQKGNNIIRLSNPKTWMPDIDYIEITPTSSGIQDVSQKKEHSSAIYDLQGRVLSRVPDKGIYIQGGKKRF